MDTSTLDLIAVVGDQTWRSPGWPVAVEIANAVIAVVVGVGLFVHSRYGGLGQRVPGLVTVVLTPLFAGLACALPFALVPATLMADAKFAIEAFWIPFWVELTGSGVAMVAVGAGVAAWLHAPRGDAPLPVLPLLLVPVVVALALAGPAHILALNAEGPLPTLDIDLGPRVHVGTDTTVAVQLNEHAASGWFAPPVRVAPAAPGVIGIELRAERVGLKGVRIVTREAGDDRGTPLFPLGAHYSWDLEETVSHQAQYLWFWSGDHTASGSHIHVAVAPGSEGALHTWIVSRTDDDGPPVRWTVYNWNGELLDSEGDQPFLRAGEPTDDHLTACGLELFEGWDCACGRPPAPPDHAQKGWRNPWEIAGPARCTHEDQPGAVRTGVGALLAMVTAGLVIDMGDASHTVVLTRSGTDPG